MEATIDKTQSVPLINKLVKSKIFWFLMTGFFFGYPVMKSVQRSMPMELPVLSTLPSFKLIDENNKLFGSDELKGKIYIANFIFTSCQTSCPVLLKTIQTVQHRLRGVIDRAAIVSFSVDPETDTPEVLFNKAREMKANSSVWRFLTGPREAIKTLLIDGFKVPVGEKEIANNIMDVAHSNKLVLVDGEGAIRGYYNSDKDGINRLMIDTGILINTKKKTI